jgi:hypothetical protein
VIFIPLFDGADDLVGDGADAYASALAGGQDLDGDGFPDMAVGAPDDDAAGTDAGAVYVYFGTGAGLATADPLVLTGESAGDAFGSALALVPDVDGDGLPELAVGAPGAGAGAVYVYVGLAAPAAPLIGEGAGDTFGAALAAGDLDGDGLGDLVVGAPEAGAGDGAAYAYLNAAGTAAWSVSGSAAEHFGQAVAVVPDVNGDGDDEIAVSAPDHVGATSTGTVALYPGGPRGPGVTAMWAFPENADDEGVGASLAAGDFDRDGHGDLAIGTPVSYGRQVTLWFSTGTTLDSAPGWTSGMADYPDTGEARVGNVGDLDGDGVDELAVSVYVDGSSYSCGPETYRRNVLRFGTGVEVDLYIPPPSAFAPAGDLDGDGLGDLALGDRDGTALDIRLMRADDDEDDPHGIAAAAAEDCDDADASVGLGAEETDSDGVDSDCDGADDRPATHPITCPTFSTLAEARAYVLSGRDYAEAECPAAICFRDVAEEVWEVVEAGGVVSRVPDPSDEDKVTYTWPVEGDGWSGRALRAGVSWMSWGTDYDGSCDASANGETDTVLNLHLDAPTTAGVVAARGLVTSQSSSYDDPQTSGHVALTWEDGTSGYGSWSTDRYSVNEYYYAYYGATATVDAAGCTYSSTWSDDIGAGGTARWQIEADGHTADVEVYGCPSVGGYAWGVLDGKPGAVITSDTWEIVPGDSDGDGYPAVLDGEEYDTDDADPDVHPCGHMHDVDSDRDGVPDADDCAPEDASASVAGARWPDADGDGYGDAFKPARPGEFCGTPAGWADEGNDCDDSDPDVFPGAPEHCDGRDEDCDSVVDDNAVDDLQRYEDVDDDGYGTGIPHGSCEPEGRVTLNGDCDDHAASRHPGAAELPGDGIDQDCDGADSVVDAAEDGAGGCATGGCATGGTRTTGGIALLLAMLALRRRR